MQPLAPPTLAHSSSTSSIERGLRLLLGILVALACWAWFSISLDDPDSALFIAGVERFSLAESRPHPPGYPIYILFGKFIVLFGAGPRTALQAVSCISAGITAALLPDFFRALRCTRAGAWACTFAVLATPLFGLTSCKILTDSAGFAIVLPLTTRWLRNASATGFGYGAGLALGLGVRPHGILYLLPGLWYRPRARRLMGFVATFALLVLGLVLIEGGTEIREAMAAQATMRFKNPGVSLFSPGTGLGGALERLMRFQMVFFRDLLGVNGMLLKIPATLLIAAGSVRLWRMGAAKSAAHSAASETQEPEALRWLLGGAAFYMLFLYLFLPAHPRYFLPLVPLLIATLTLGRTWIAMLLALLMIPISATRIQQLHSEPVPLEQALEWMEQTDPEHEFPLLYGHLIPHARVLTPERKMLEPALLAKPGEHIPRFFARWAELKDLPLAPGSSLVMIERRVFERSRLLHDKLATVEVVLVEVQRP